MLVPHSNRFPRPRGANRTSSLGAALALIAGLLAGDGVSCAEESFGRVAGWRGDGEGRFPKVSPPVDWSPGGKAKVVWQTQVGSGYSSPIVVGNRVIIASDPDQLVCLSRDRGEVLWRRTTDYSELPNAQELQARKLPSTACGYTTPTPVCDGNSIYVTLGTGLVARYDLDGKRLWLRHFDDGPPPQYGRSASPVLVDNKLMVQVSWLRALDPANGATIWEAKPARETYGSLAVTRIGDTDLLISPNGDMVRASDGALLAASVAQSGYTQPMARDGVAYFVDSFSVAVQLPDNIDAPFKPQELWTQELEGGGFFASPLLEGARIYATSSNGHLSVLDAKDGKILVHRKLDFGQADGQSRSDDEPHAYPSVCLANDKLFLGSDQGQVWVHEPGPECRLLASPRLPAGSGSTPTFFMNQAFFRAGDLLLCIQADSS